ncbi:MAG: hypothetical protein Q9170_004780 [Blastenia crenularia]
MTLYAFGSNGCGQLGIGDTEDTDVPQPCQLLDEKEWPSPIRSIKGGGSHTLVLLESGELFVTGSVSKLSPDANISTEPISKYSRIPSKVFGGSKVRFCSALWEASVIVTTTDEIYTFGIGLKGELGLGAAKEALPRKLDRFWPQGEEIVDLTSGMSHTLVVLSNGDVYGWGNGRKGQLGEPAGLVWMPRKIDNIALKVVRALCGREFSYLVGNPNNGHHTILGSDKHDIKSAAPPTITGWKDVGASWGSIFIINVSDDFIAWGRNDHGQTGPERRPEIFARIAAGSEHALALTGDGTVAAWGWGEHGNCGPGVDSQGDVKGWWNSLHPYRFGKNSKILGIAAGCATSFVWTVDQNHEFPSEPKGDGARKLARDKPS